MTTGAIEVRPGTIALINNNPGTIETEMSVSVINSAIADINRDRRLVHIKLTIGGAILSIYRNMNVEYFLTQTPAEWYLSVDSDHGFDIDDIYSLHDRAVNENLSIVGGLYTMGLGEGVRPSLFSWQDKEMSDGSVHKLMTPWEWDDIEVGKCYQVDGTGAGFLLIHRNVFDAMKAMLPPPEPWFGVDIIDGIVNGEDFTFCARAAKCGFPTYVDTNVRINHFKKARFHPDMFLPNTNNDTE